MKSERGVDEIENQMLLLSKDQKFQKTFSLEHHVSCTHDPKLVTTSNLQHEFS